MKAADVLAFLGELALVAALGGAATAMADGVTAVALGVLLVLGLVLVWGRWLAPRAPRRLPSATRLATKLALVVVTAALLALGGRPEEGALVLAVVGAVFAWAEVSGGRGVGA